MSEQSRPGTKAVKLKEICIKESSSLRQKDLLAEGLFPVYGAAGIAGTLNEYQIDKQYVAVIKDGAGVGRARLCDSKTSVLGTMQALVPRDSVMPEYLLYLVRSMNLGSGFTGSTIPHIYFRDYGERTVPLPSMEQQALIARRFRQVEGVIGILNAQFTVLDDLVKSRFVEMFGDPVNGGFWPMKELGEIYRVSSSRRIYAKEQTKEGVPFYRLADVGCLADGLIPADGLFISEERFTELNEAGYVPSAGDILVTARGTLGRCYIIREDDRFYFQDGMITWLGQTEMSPRSGYLAALFSNEHFSKSLNDSCSGTTVRYLSISDLAKTSVPIPPFDVQDTFLRFVAQVDKTKAVVQQSIDKLQMLYDSLAQEYFGGGRE